MVDTLKVRLNGFDVRPGHLLTIQPAAYTPATGEMKGNYRLWPGVEGRSAYYNGENFNLTVESQHGRVEPVIQLSLPRYYYGTDNLNPVSKEQAAAVLGDLQRQLNLIGIGCNLEDARLSRVDAFRNVETSEPFPTFAPVLSLLEGRRMRDKVEFGGTSFRWANTVSQINVYDKLSEMQAKRHDISRYAGRNIIRFEHRTTDKRKIGQLYGFSTVAGFVKEFDSIGDSYRKELSGGLFRYTGEEVEVLGRQQLRTEMEWFKRNCGRRWMSAYWEAAGLRWTLQRTTPESVAKVIEEVSGDRNKAWRNRQKMHTALLRQKMLTPAEVNYKTYRTLYRELRDGVLKAA